MRLVFHNNLSSSPYVCISTTDCALILEIPIAYRKLNIPRCLLKMVSFSFKVCQDSMILSHISKQKKTVSEKQNNIAPRIKTTKFLNCYKGSENFTRTEMPGARDPNI